MLAILRRSIAEPLICWISGSPKVRYWKAIEETQFLPESRLYEIQRRRLRELLMFVWERNSFYRRRFELAGLAPGDIKLPEDMRRLPILTKAEVRAQTPALISRGFDAENLQNAKTGGSTGKALELFFTEGCSELRNAVARRHDRWAGWEPGEPIGACWGNPHLAVTFRDRLRQYLVSPIIYLDTMRVNEASVRAFAREWERVGPTLLFGHSHSLFTVANYMKELGIDSVHPKGIVASSMMLIPSEREFIEEFFGVRVTDRYGCEEVSLIASECEKHEGMHLNIEHILVEFVRDDGSACAPGELGRIVVTDLINKAMPLIRYQVEDMGVPTDRKCSCGRGLPLMESVAGRVADFLVRRDGTKVAGVSLIENTLTRFLGLDQMQIIQHELERFEIRIVAGPSFLGVERMKLVDYFKIVFGQEVKVEVTTVNEILPEKSGKYRFSICQI